MSIFDHYIRVGRVTLVPDGKRVNMIQVTFPRGATHQPSSTEWVSPKEFPMVPKLGDRVRLTIVPTITRAEVIR